MVADDRLTQQGKPGNATNRVSRRQDYQLSAAIPPKTRKGDTGEHNAASSLLSGNTAPPSSMHDEILLSSSLVGSQSGGPTTHWRALDFGRKQLNGGHDQGP